MLGSKNPNVSDAVKQDELQIFSQEEIIEINTVQNHLTLAEVAEQAQESNSDSDLDGSLL